MVSLAKNTVTGQAGGKKCTGNRVTAECEATSKTARSLSADGPTVSLPCLSRVPEELAGRQEVRTVHGAAAACRRQRLGFTVSTRRTGDSESGNSDQNVKRRLRWGLALAAYAGISAYYRFRQQPPGIDGGPCRRFRVPAESIGFHHDTTWYEDDERQSVLQITDELIRLIEAARRFVVMDVFLFSLHHADRASDYLPTTRQIVDAFRVHERPAWFITDPINTSYGSWISPPLQWLEQAGVQVVVTNLRKLRDNNL